MSEPTKERLREAVLDCRALWQLLYVNAEHCVPGMERGIYRDPDAPKKWALEELDIAGGDYDCPMCVALRDECEFAMCELCFNWVDGYSPDISCTKPYSPYKMWRESITATATINYAERIVQLCNGWLKKNGYQEDLWIQ